RFTVLHSELIVEPVSARFNESLFDLTHDELIASLPLGFLILIHGDPTRQGGPSIRIFVLNTANEQLRGHPFERIILCPNTLARHTDALETDERDLVENEIHKRAIDGKIVSRESRVVELEVEALRDLPAGDVAGKLPSVLGIHKPHTTN